MEIRLPYRALLAISFAAFLATPVLGDIVYKPINPSFGGEPFNSSHLQGLAGSQNVFKKEGGSSAQSPSERFVSMLQSRLYSAFANQVSEAIFGENAQPNGTITFDDQQIVFVNSGNSIELTITDFTTGEVTTIVIPNLVTN